MNYDLQCQNVRQPLTESGEPVNTILKVMKPSTSETEKMSIQNQV